jgi:hypothetical protein
MMHAHTNASTVSGKRHAFMSDRPFGFQQTTAAPRMLVNFERLTREPQRAREARRQIQLRMVDQHEIEFELPKTQIAAPISADEPIEPFAACAPCPFDTDCRLRIASPFYEGLHRLRDAHLERAWGRWQR